MKLAPTFSYLIDPRYVRMTKFNDDGTVNEYIDVSSNFEYAVIYFELIKTYNYNMGNVLTEWNKLWNNGTLDDFKLLL